MARTRISRQILWLILAGIPHVCMAQQPGQRTAITACALVALETMSPVEVTDEPDPGRGNSEAPDQAGVLDQVSQSARRELRPVVHADVRRDADLTWTTSLGEGGIYLPRLPDPQDEKFEQGSFTKLVGAVLLPEEREVLFLGVHEEGFEPLKPNQLLDAFVMAYRAVSTGASPGVSIDPAPEQLARGLNEGDAMDVVYFGGIEDADFGFAAFESDRLMKCLSFGKDNVTKTAVTCDVPGYESELDLVVRLPHGRNQAWHRFWIEHGKSVVEQSSDGRTFLVDVGLVVNTQYMRVSNGKLVPGNEAADPAAKAFADHLTKHYRQYAMRFPEFNRLAAYAVLTSLADALVPDSDDSSETPRIVPQLDPVWLLIDHQTQTATTPTTTPAIVVRRQKDISPNTRREVRLTGGVTLNPSNRYIGKSKRADAIQQAVLRTRASQPRGRDWSVGGTPYRAVSARQQRRRRIWQADLRVGDVTVVRDFASSSPDTALGEGWSIRVPRISVSEETADYEQVGKAPRSVTVRCKPEEVVSLSRFAELTIPGQGPTPGYVSADGKCRLLMYSNAWIFIREPIDFVSINGGSPQIKINPGGQLAKFDPSGQHRVESLQTSDGIVEYSYQNDRLISMSDGRQNSVRISYEDGGRIDKLIASDSRQVNYGYDRFGRLKHVSSPAGTLDYIYHHREGVPTGLRCDIQSPESIDATSQFVVYRKPDNLPVPRDRSDLEHGTRMARVTIEPSVDSQDGHEIRIDGKPVELNESLESIVYRINTERDSQAIDILRRGLLSHEGLKGCDSLLITGEWNEATDLAVALQQVVKSVNVFTATDANLAVRNTQARPLSTEPPRVHVIKEGLDPNVCERLMSIPKGLDESNTVIIVGHNSSDLVEYVTGLGNSRDLEGKDVILVTCGTNSTPGVVESALRDAGAVSVTGFLQPIQQHLLDHIVRRLQRRMVSPSEDTGSNTKRGDRSVSEMLRATIKDILDEYEQDGLPEQQHIRKPDIDVLRWYFERLGKTRLRTLEFVLDPPRDSITMAS